MKVTPIYVGRAIRELRDLRGLTQKDLAGRAELNPLTISQIETGHRGASMTLLTKLARILRVPASYFYVLADETDDPLVQEMQQLVRDSVTSEARRKRARIKRVARQAAAG